jgi:hypothetical protein
LIPWSLKVVQPLIVRAFRVESGRSLLALKAYADKLPQAAASSQQAAERR